MQFQQGGVAGSQMHIIQGTRSQCVYGPVENVKGGLQLRVAHSEAEPLIR